MGLARTGPGTPCHAMPYHSIPPTAVTTRRLCKPVLRGGGACTTACLGGWARRL